MKDNVAIVIPAYNPDENLEKVVEELIKNNYKNIVIVDDGSEDKIVFSKISNLSIILQHSKNEGKGKALKTGFKYCLDKLDSITTIITVDADGQHKIEDINKVYDAIKENTVIVGSREFKRKVAPLRSRIGNKMISKVVENKTGVKLTDTQTGLRAIPIKYINEILRIDGTRYEYETNMLLYFINNRIKIIEIPIQGVYINKNKASHFKTIKDSLRIYMAIVKK